MWSDMQRQPAGGDKHTVLQGRARLNTATTGTSSSVPIPSFNCCRMMLEDFDDWIPGPPGDKVKEKTTATTTEKKKKKKKKLKKPGEEKTRRSGKGSTPTTADNQEASPLSTSPPACYPEPSTSSTSSSMSTPTSPLVSRRRKDALRWSSNEVPTRTGGSDIVRSKVDLLGDLDSSGEVEYYDVYDEGEGEGEEEEEECNGASRKSGKAISAPDLSRARKVEMVVSKLYELGNAAPQNKKKRFLQRFGILGDVEQQQEELKYKQLNDEIQSLSHELALSPRGSHASPVLSLKAMKLLGMVNLDVTSAGRWNQDVDYDLEASDAGGSSPPTQSSPSSSSSTATRSKPAPNNNTAVPLKAMKMLGVMEGAGSSTNGKKSRSVIHRGGDRGPSAAAAASTPLSNSGNNGQLAADDESTSPEPVLSPLAMLLDWKGRRGRSNSKEVSLLDSLTSSSSSESEASPHTVRVRRARTLSKEELTDSSIVQDRDMLDRRERRARTLSKGI